jgi:hypothetical protein
VPLLETGKNRKNCTGNKIIEEKNKKVKINVKRDFFTSK